MPELKKIDIEYYVAFFLISVGLILLIWMKTFSSIHTETEDISTYIPGVSNDDIGADTQPHKELNSLIITYNLFMSDMSSFDSNYTNAMKLLMIDNMNKDSRYQELESLIIINYLINNKQSHQNKNLLGLVALKNLNEDNEKNDINKLSNILIQYQKNNYQLPEYLRSAAIKKLLLDN